MQVILTLHAPVFDKIPFFKDKHPQLLQNLLPHLKLEYYMAHEYVVWQNDRSTRMFFISEGMVEARVCVESSPDISAFLFALCHSSVHVSSYIGFTEVCSPLSSM